MKRIIKDTSFAVFFLLVIALVAAEAATSSAKEPVGQMAASRK